MLPAKNLFEQTDVIGAYWHPYLQIRQKVVEPPPEVRPETEIYRALGRRLGIAEEALAAALPGPSDEAVEAWLDGAARAARAHARPASRRARCSRPSSRRSRSPTCASRRRRARSSSRSGEARARWGARRAARASASRRSGRSPAGRFPLHLLTPNTKNRIHSQFGNLETIRRMAPAPFVAMHPRDARARGLAEGERRAVFNERGELTLPVKLDWGLRPGCVA